MSDLIDRQAAIDAIDECYCGGEDSCGEPWIYKENAVEAIQMIEPIPSAQPQIIRCKDCKHYIPYDWMFSEVWQSRNIADYPEDEIGCALNDMVVKANDFCSLGERKRNVALDMAISALSCSEIPNSSDCISRQAAIDIVEFECGEWSGLAKTIAEEIKQLPSAQPEQSIAEWQKDFREYINMLNIPRDDYKRIMEYINEVPSAQPEQCEDAVPRASVEYICRKNTVSTNPYEHEHHEKFIKFMDDPEIADFGRWQHSNGFNTALVAVKCDLDKVPPVTPKQRTGKWIHISEEMWKCDQCGEISCCSPRYCPDCGSRNEVTE